MANTQGQIQVGSSHQARLPPLQADVRPEDMPESCEALETLVWQPDAIMDGDLLMYLRAARSMAAFVGWCDGGSTDDGCAAASMDETTINSLHMLHQHNYDTGKALQALVKIINPKSVDKRWSDDDAKKFVRGLKQHGKNFFKIRKELLQNKETAQLVEYYYLWKKTPAASTTRPHRRHRRPALRRQATPTLPSSEYMEEMSSASEGSGNESYEENDQPSLVSYSCHQCHTTKSANWYEVGKENNVFCVECYSFISNEDAVVDETNEPPPFMFRPVKEEATWKHSLPELDKLGSEGKESSSCPETSDEGRPEERTSPSAASTYSSTSSLAKDMAPVCISKESATPSKDVADETPKCCVEADGDNASPAKNRVASPSDSLSDDSSSYGQENEDNEHDSDIENNQDEVSSGGCSNVPSPSELYSKHADADLAPKEMSEELPASSKWTALEHVIPKEMESTEEKGSCKAGSGSEDAMLIHSRQWLSFGSADMKVTDSSMSSCVAIKEEPDSNPDFSTATAKIKSEARPDDTDHTDQSKRVQLPTIYMHWPEVKGRDDVKPQRAVASVAPTQLTKQENLETMHTLGVGRVQSPHYPLQPPPPLAPLTMSLPAPTRNETNTPSLHLSPVANSLQMSDGGYVSHQPVKIADSYVQAVSDGRRLSPPPSGPMAVPRNRSRSGSRSRSRSPLRDSDSEPEEVRHSPSPEPHVMNDEIHRSKTAIFIRHWYRGSNTCSRCDFEFLPFPGSKLSRRREEKLVKAAHSAKMTHGSGAGVSKENRKTEPRKEEDKKKPNTPPENRTSDAQITSSLMAASHHMSSYGPERLTPRGPYPVGHDPTPALSQLSAYARPHIGGAARDLQRCMPFGLSSFPPQSMDPYFRMPGVFPPGSREAMEMEMERDKRETWEREIREMEFMEKMKQEMDLKPPGFDRLPPHLGAAGAVDPIWAELHRRSLGLPGGPPPGHLANIYPGNLTDLGLIQRERERLERNEMARLTQEQQLAAASSRDSSALYQLYQRHAHDPAVLHRQLNAYLAMSANKVHESEVARMMEASHLVYHFARADPLAAAGPAAGQGAPPHLPPPSHALSQGHSMLMAAREQERFYLELLSRPSYNTDPLLAQQLSVQAAQNHEVIRQLERECLATGSMMLH